MGQFSQVRRLFLPSKAYFHSKNKIEYQISCRVIWKSQAGARNAERLLDILVFLLKYQETSIPESLGFASFKGQKPSNGSLFARFWDPQVHL